MKIVNKIQATRQLEYVCFFIAKFNILEGPAFAFFSVDAYSDFAFSTGVELSDEPENILKHILLIICINEFWKNYVFPKHLDEYFTSNNYLIQNILN